MKTRRNYLTLEPARRIKIWRQIYTPRTWWQRLLDRLDRIFWP